MHQIRQKKPKPSKRNATGSSIAPSIDDRADERCASDERRRVMRIRRARSSIAPRDRRSRRAISSIAIVDRQSRRVDRRSRRRDRRSLFSLSLSDLGFLFSLSLSLFPEVIWSENEGSNWFPGQRWKNWSTGSHFPENDIFRDSQTCGKGWKWFPEIIFTQNKRTLSLVPAVISETEEADVANGRNK